MYRLIVIMLSILLGASTTASQTTGFTYQGRLTDGGTPASGPYDLQFALWDSQSSGTQIGSTQSLNSVQVTNGVFTVTLDFGANAFPGASRFLAISARVSGPGSFTLLTPRQPITSTPYAVRSLNAATVDSVPLSAVPAGSGNYIQNTSAQQTANLNINGNASAGGTMSGNVVNAATQFNLGGSRILSSLGTDNLFAGVDAGAANTIGNSNNFFGNQAGLSNTSGEFNSFFGVQAGVMNTTGSLNSFFGSHAGGDNVSGSSNSFFGNSAGGRNISGGSNSFFGIAAGQHNTTGSGNTFLGNGAGTSNATGSENTAVGVSSRVGVNLTNATAIGSHAWVTQSNSLVLGSTAGVGDGTVDTNVGIGTSAPNARLHVRANAGNILLGDPGCGSGFAGIGFFGSEVTCSSYALLGGDGSTYINRQANGTIIFREGNGPNQVEIRPGGTVGLAVLGSAGSTALCLNSIRAISTCSSSLRYKTDVRPFASGLQLINRLQPVSFNWKTTHRPDIGLIAEEVAKVEPRLTFKNQSGEIEGVNYSQLTAVLINAIKEQQNQIEQLRKEVRQLRKTSRHQQREPARRKR